jgi:hypothetical protein
MTTPANGKAKHRRGLGQVYQRGPIWWVCLWHRGRRIRESSNSEVRSEAVALLQRRLGEIGKRRVTAADEARVCVSPISSIPSPTPTRTMGAAPSKRSSIASRRSAKRSGPSAPSISPEPASSGTKWSAEGREKARHRQPGIGRTPSRVPPRHRARTHHTRPGD